MAADPAAVTAFVSRWHAFVAVWAATQQDSPAEARALVDRVLEVGLDAWAEDAGTPPEASPEEPSDEQAMACEIAVVSRSGQLADRPYAQKNARIEPASWKRENWTSAEHFCRVGWGLLRNPSLDFDVWWYWAEYLDPTRSDVNPFLHYLLVGTHRGYAPLPPRTPLRSHSPRPTAGSRRICLFAGYDPEGLVDDTVLDYLTELGRHADVYYLADGFLEPEELEKISAVTCGAWNVAHEAYDFGSYSMLARDLVGWDVIAEYDELVLANDSVYLLRPLTELFARMDALDCDWWGMQATKYAYDEESELGYPLSLARTKELLAGGRYLDEVEHLHISSYFLVYRSAVHRDAGFRRRLDSVVGQPTKSLVVVKYEIGIGRYLASRGYDFETFVPNLYAFHPLYTREYFDRVAEGFPFLKRNLLSENSLAVPGLAQWKERIAALVPEAPVDKFETNLRRVSADDSLHRSFSVVAEEDGRPRARVGPTHEEWLESDRLSPTFDHWWVFPVSSTTHDLSADQRAVFDEVAADPSVRKIVLTRRRRLSVAGENVVTATLLSDEAHELVRRAGVFVVQEAQNVAVPFPVGIERHHFVHVGAAGHSVIAPPTLTGRDLSVRRYHNDRIFALVAASEADATAALASHAPLALDRLWVTGAPRLDHVLRPSDELAPDLRAQEESLEQMLDGRRLVTVSTTPSVRPATGMDKWRLAPDQAAWLQDWARRHDAVIAYREHRDDRYRRLRAALAPAGAVRLPSDVFTSDEILHRRSSLHLTDDLARALDATVTGQPVFLLDDREWGQPELLAPLDQVFAGRQVRSFDELAAGLEHVFDGVPEVDAVDDALRRERLFGRPDDRNARRLVTRLRDQLVADVRI